MKRVLWGLGLFAVVLVALLALVRLALMTEPGRNFVERRIEATQASGQMIEIEGLSGDLLGRFSATRLEVSDAEGGWLVIRDLEFAWTPRRLLGGQLDVERIAAGAVEIARKPDIEAQPDDRSKTDNGDGLPISAFVFQDITIDRITVEEAAAGVAAEFRLIAKARHMNGQGHLEGAVETPSGAGDRIHADLDWGGDIPLRGTAALDAPPGGLFARLARLPGGEGLNARLDARGEPDAWSAEADLAIAAREAVSLRARGQQATGRLEAGIDLSAHPRTRELVGQLGTRIDLTADISQTDMDRRRLDATLTSETVELGVEGPLAPSDMGPFRVALIADEPARLAGLADIEARRLTLNGEFAFDGGPKFEGDLALDDLSAQDWSARRIAGPVRVRSDDESVQLVTNLSGEAVNGPGRAGALTGSAPRLDLDARYANDTGRLQIAQARVETRGLRADATGGLTLDLAQADLKGRITLDGARTAAIPVSAEVDWTLVSADRKPRLEAHGNVQDLPDLPEPLASWAGEQLTFEILATGTPGGTLNIERLVGQGRDLKVNAQGQINPEGRLFARLDAQTGSARINDLQVEPLNLALDIGGTLNTPDVSGKLATAQLRMGDTVAEEVVVSLDAGLEGETAQGLLTIQAMIEGAPLSARLPFRAGGDSWALPDGRITWKDLVAQFDLERRDTAQAFAQGTLALTGALPGNGPVGAIALDARLGESGVRIDADLQEVKAGPLSTSRLNIRAEGPISELPFLVSSKGMLDLDGQARQFSFNMGGAVRTQGETGPALRLDPRLKMEGLRIAAEKPLRLALTDAGPRGTGALAINQGKLRFDLVAGTPQRLDLALEEIAVLELLELTGQPLYRGTLSGRAELAGTAQGPRGDASLRLIGLNRPGGRGQPLDVTLDATLRPENLDLVAHLGGPPDLDLAAEITVALEHTGGAWGVIRAKDTPVRATLSGGGPISPISDLFAPSMIDFDGRLRTNIAASWPLAQGGLMGTLALEDGRFEHGELGLVLEDIALDTALDGQTLRLKRLSARDAADGQLSGSGVYRLGGRATSLALSAQGLRLVDLDAVKARASGRIALEDTETGAVLAGDLRIDRAEIDLDRLPGGGGLATLDVRFDAPDASPPAPEPDDVTRLALDLGLTAPGRIFVSGSGLDAELSLQSRITGALGGPSLVGQANIVRGRFDLAGKRFTFTDSTVRFNGDPAKASLDVQATRETEALSAIVAVSGTPLAPQVSLSSQPPLPEDEVLSRVLFGRSPAELTPLEGAQLAAALAQLARGSGGPNPLGGLENALGLDTLDVSQDTAGGAQVATGKYLADNVYLEVRTGSDGQPSFAIEWQPIENIEVDADVTADENQELSIQWVREFD